MQKRRKVISVLLILLCLIGLLSQTAAAATVTVSAPTVEGQNGNTVDVPIQMTGATGLGAVHLELNYDASALSAPEVTRGTLAGSNALMETNVKQPGKVILGIVSLDGIKGDGTLATVRFQVKGAAGTSSMLDFQNNQAWERESHAEVLVNTQPGKVTIAAGLPNWLIPAGIAVVVALFLFLLLFFLLRRRQAPQHAYAPSYASAAYAQPAPPATFPRSANVAPNPQASNMPRGATPPMDLPERRSAANSPVNIAAFKRSEDEYFKLKGQLATNRITQAEFEAMARELMVQDSQGRYWMLGADTGKWYLHDGAQWVEGTPY
jgi:Cohesin domain